eukprot:15065366-Alexandrium_andersonii.AAC.1
MLALSANNGTGWAPRELRRPSRAVPFAGRPVCEPGVCRFKAALTLSSRAPRAKDCADCGPEDCGLECAIARFRSFGPLKP